MNKNNKLLALFISILLVAMLFLSYSFIIHNAHHDCAGEDCQICLQLQMVKQFVSGLKILPVLSFIMAILSVFTLVYAMFDKFICVKNTLILLKVELLD